MDKETIKDLLEGKLVRVTMVPDKLTDPIDNSIFTLKDVLEHGYVSTGVPLAVEIAKEIEKLAEWQTTLQQRFDAGKIGIDVGICQNKRVNDRYDELDRNIHHTTHTAEIQNEKTGKFLKAEITISILPTLPGFSYSPEQVRRSLSKLLPYTVKQLLDNGEFSLSDKDYLEYTQAEDRTKWLADHEIKGGQFNLFWMKDAAQELPNVEPVFADAVGRLRMLAVPEQVINDFKTVTSLLTDDLKQNYWRHYNSLMLAISRIALAEARRNPLDLSGNRDLAAEADKTLGKMVENPRGE
ncbi:MAG: hypothetical protein ABSG57_04265 [Candidatus Bathyarchaeia archaeon]